MAALRYSIQHSPYPSASHSDDFDGLVACRNPWRRLRLAPTGACGSTALTQCPLSLAAVRRNKFRPYVLCLQVPYELGINNRRSPRHPRSKHSDAKRQQAAAHGRRSASCDSSRARESAQPSSLGLPPAATSRPSHLAATRWRGRAQRCPPPGWQAVAGHRHRRPPVPVRAQASQNDLEPERVSGPGAGIACTQEL